MALIDLSLSLGNRIVKTINSQMYDWILAVSKAVDTLVTVVGPGSGIQAETRYVDKAGSDATGTGSFNNPFLTIQAAITSITDATVAKPYTVEVGPGIYTETFAIIPFVYVNGIDQLSCILNPVTANWITAGFAAGAQDAGLSNFTLRSAFVVDFNLVASLGAGTFTLSQILLDTGGNITFRGNNAANVANIQDLASKNAAAGTQLTLASIAFVGSGVNLRSGNCVITSTDAYTVLGRMAEGFSGGSLSITWTGAVTANFLTITSGPMLFPNGITISGAATSLIYLDIINNVAPDADTQYSFGSVNPAGAVILAQRARNYIRAAPTANRTFSFDPPRGIGTHVFLKNESAFFITIAFTNGATGVGAQSYIGPFGSLEMWGSSGLPWEIMNDAIQSGNVTLTNGVTAVLIPADITAQSAITATLKDINGGVLGASITAKATDRVIGTRAGGGGFKLTSTTAAGVTVATDQGIYDWIVQRP